MGYGFRSYFQAFPTGQESTLFKLRSILGAWTMKLLPQDRVTRKLVKANARTKRLPGQALPPSHDLHLHHRWAMPIVLPIQGIAR